MKKTLLVIMAALSMLLTQCKKSEAESPSDGKPVNITLNVGGNSKINVNPGDGTVAFTTGDKIYVASGGVYVGTLTTQDGKTFSGTITKPKEGEPLHFYFLDNKIPDEGLTEGITNELKVNISNQSEGLPVISYAPSNENYPSSNATYTSVLLNKCALAKFNVSNYTGNGDVSIKGMNNQVTVALSNNTFSYDKINDGEITLNKNNNGYWAILLPQDAVEGGEAHSSDGWSGTYGNVPAITINGYLNEGIAVNLTEPAPMYTFTINADGDKVEFSPGNLYYDDISSSWNFEAHQWDYRTYQGLDAFIDGETPVTKTPDGHWGLFGWSGGQTNTRWGKSTSTTNSDYSGTFEDWGTNTIDEDVEDTWHTLKLSEWEYILNTRNINNNIRYVYATLTNGVKGLIIFPDNYNSTTTNLDYIPEGAVFLPAAGFRNGTQLNTNGWGYYRSSEKNASNTYGWNISFNSTQLMLGKFNNMYYGYSVRLVRDCSK